MSKATKLLTVLDIIPFDGKPYGFGNRKTVILIYGDGKQDHFLALESDIQRMMENVPDHQELPPIEDAIALAVASRSKTAISDPTPTVNRGHAINNEAGRDGLDPDDATLEHWVVMANSNHAGFISKLCAVQEGVLYRKPCRRLSDEIRRVICEIRSEELAGTNPSDKGIPMGLIPFLNGEFDSQVANLPESYQPTVGVTLVTPAAETILNAREEVRQSTLPERIAARLAGRG